MRPRGDDGFAKMTASPGSGMSISIGDCRWLLGGKNKLARRQNACCADLRCSQHEKNKMSRRQEDMRIYRVRLGKLIGFEIN